MKFDINIKALKSLGSTIMPTNTIAAAFNGRTKSVVEACGADHSNVIGKFAEPSSAEYVEDFKAMAAKETDPKRKANYQRFVDEAPRVTAFSHGLMEAVHLSYADHYPLALSPDVIWLTIAQGFANHVNANAETLRKKFVSHQGKEMILIERDSFIKGSPDNDWQGCFGEFSSEIAKRIGKTRDLVVSEFSTTTALAKAASELVLMDSMKVYFKYAVRTLCGIPSITLLGSKEDWRSVRTRAENLAEFDLSWWIKPLIPVLDQFVAAAEGKQDIKFWDEMYKLDGGSGGPHCSGWINTLFPYLDKGRKNHTLEGMGYGVTMDNYPNSLSKVPFKWQYYTNTHDMEFIGGIIGVNQNPDTLEVQPSLGWAVRDTGLVKEGPIDSNQDW